MVWWIQEYNSTSPTWNDSTHTFIRTLNVPRREATPRIKCTTLPELRSGKHCCEFINRNRPRRRHADELLTEGAGVTSWWGQYMCFYCQPREREKRERPCFWLSKYRRWLIMIFFLEKPENFFFLGILKKKSVWEKNSEFRKIREYGLIKSKTFKVLNNI